MKTTFSLLCDRCGLSQQTAADLLNVRLDTVKSWSNGRNGCPPGVIEQLRALYAIIERSAAEALKQIKRIKPKPDEIEIGIASDDHEARQPPIGLPCVGAHAAVLGLVAAKSPVPVMIVPRGSTVATAAAIEVHEAAMTGKR